MYMLMTSHVHTRMLASVHSSAVKLAGMPASPGGDLAAFIAATLVTMACLGMTAPLANPVGKPLRQIREAGSSWIVTGLNSIPLSSQGLICSQVNWFLNSDKSLT